MAGGVPKYVPLHFAEGCKSAADWKVDLSELEATISAKTKMIMINTPQNIPGTFCLFQGETVAKGKYSASKN
jgi:aspartate/methionine/tyrosine aminotransferase